MPNLDRSHLTVFFLTLLCLPLVACGGHSSNLATEHSAGLPLDSELMPPVISEADPQPWLTGTRPAPLSLEQRWIVNAAEAKQLIEAGATLLDARKQRLAMGRLQGAIAVNWVNFSPSESAKRGRLLDDDAQLTQQLQALGISAQTPVVVFANPPNGWGEDGRIVWMLRTLGHPQAVLVDGGFQALVEAKVPFQKGAIATPAPGDFVVHRESTWDIQKDDLRNQLGSDNLAIIDTREPREFGGKTPYGEQRGGHLPNAINLHFKAFFQDDGTLKSPPALITKLAEAGITPDTPVVVYCTGGVRSGWLAAVLVTLGYPVRNYAGSMWEWSAAPADSYPLQYP